MNEHLENVRRMVEMSDFNEWFIEHVGDHGFDEVYEGLKAAWNASREQAINECVEIADKVNDKACEGFNTSPAVARTANEIANKLKDLK